MWKCSTCQTDNWDSATVCHKCAPEAYASEARAKRLGTEPETPQETDDEELDPLDKLLLAVVLESAEAIDNLAAKSDDNPSSFMEVCRELNPGAISLRSVRAVDDIERYVRANVNELLSDKEGSEDWTEIAYPQLRAGWLRMDVLHAVMNLERTLRDMRSAAMSFGRFWQNNEGIGGFVKRAIGGYLNPLDGWLAFVGKNSTQTEQAFLISELADAFSEVGNAIETLKEDIVTKIRLKVSEITTSVS